MFNHPLSLLGLTPQKERQLVNKGLTTVEDVACFFPRRYIDFRQVKSVLDVAPGESAALRGTVVNIRYAGNRFSAVVEETPRPGSHARPQFSVVWFGSNYYIKQISIGKEYVFCGKVSEFRNQLQISSPLAFGSDPAKVCVILPIYSKIQGMSTDYLLRTIDHAIAFLQVNEKGGEKALFAASLGLMDKFEAIAQLHHPSDGPHYQKAAQRMAFEAIYDFYASLRQKDLYLIATTINQAKNDSITRDVIQTLPFALTPDQARTMETILAEAKAGHRIHSLVSGDVGCGKTMIAVLSSIFMWENGYQTILMAPTLVLAQQHYHEMQSYAQKAGMKVGLLTTETKKKERERLLRGFEEGTLSVLIGTHSVLSDDVIPKSLGLTIIDEEHKFGVAQKAKLEEYDKAGLHHLSMTATPIPRSIAQAVYGNDLAVLPIRTMPKGRKPVATRQCHTHEAAFEVIYAEVEKGRQGYIVCPFIEDSESEPFQNVTSVQAAAKEAEDFFSRKPGDVTVGIISGDMKQKDILTAIDAFAAHEIDVLVSTTIIEVGVNVPNASVIAIMSAERFGLAGLHQLRGRVGRGSDQGYCLLCSGERSERLDTLCRTNDGFEIAEYDLKMRGPGDLAGEAQSGESKIIELIMKRPKLSMMIKKKIFA